MVLQNSHKIEDIEISSVPLEKDTWIHPSPTLAKKSLSHIQIVNDNKHSDVYP